MNDLNPSYEVATYPEVVGPQRKEIYRNFNRMHEARRLGNESEIEDLFIIMPVMLDKFEKTESNESHNPKWRRLTTRAGWHLAEGNAELALEYETEGWNAADEYAEVGNPEHVSKQKAISASNIADELNRLGRYTESVDWAEKSCELWTGNPINHLVLAISLANAGRKEKAAEIFRLLIDFVNEKGHGALRVAIYEDQLAEVEIPEASELIQAVYKGM